MTERNLLLRERRVSRPRSSEVAGRDARCSTYQTVKIMNRHGRVRGGFEWPRKW